VGGEGGAATGTQSQNPSVLAAQEKLKAAQQQQNINAGAGGGACALLSAATRAHC